MARLFGEDIAVVTGASSGLGYRFARQLALNGAYVCCLARRAEKLNTLVEEIEREGGKAQAFAFDAASDGECDRIIEQIIDRVGVPTLLVNNAGQSISTKAEQMPLDQFDELMAVNVRAPWRLSQLCAQRWISDGIPGRIVNISSILGRRVQKGVAAYAISKAALTHMTAALAVEWARYGIRVNALCPGYIRTDINAAFWDTDLGKAEMQRLPRRRVMGPEKLDQALMFLADPSNDYLTGEALHVDDGQGWVI
jgi:NAD(P)-dependent dehydrogenase (short-subunit alcohol dehydrogenase family)